ncbi:DinB family protein [Foetidibacter luteolus]|uniref:DinB family protein n=1 Tax=Foetidibacter luteolus TaxID=2608880 RepID=UPI00129B5F2E|nr:DinB family protein [Foetidibacter luteolus]
MSIAQSLLPEFKHEASNTRKVLQLLPDEHFNWKPHEKSYSLGYLATHIAQLPNFITLMLSAGELDLAGDKMVRGKDSNFAEVLARFEARFAEATTALQNATDADLTAKWLLRKGDFTLFELPKVVAMRSMVFNHIIHHRGQLIVYMRLLNLKVPGLYGPSADEAS